ncbi:glycoside hydrolase family 38 C-terminal domain-containing protein [Gemmatimonadota bacterium]
MEVYNTLPWIRTELILLPAGASMAGDRVLDERGEEVPSQRLSTGELAFLAGEVPAEGMRSYRVEEGGAPQPGSPSATATLATSAYTVQVDPATGAIRSLVHAPSGRELVGADPGGLNQYLYVPGRDPATAVSAGPGSARLKEGGPLVWSVEITAPGEGLREPMVAEIRLVEGLDRVDITNRIAKAWVLDPEAVLFRFPFALDQPQVRIDVPFGSFRPELDQVPGSSKNYYSVQRWVDLTDARGGVTLTTVDAPLIQLGEIRTDAIVTGWLEEAEPSATLFSYVMNNYWETNYRAAQDDEVTFHYSLRAHGPFDEEAADRFGLEEARPLVVWIPEGTAP